MPKLPKDVREMIGLYSGHTMLWDKNAEGPMGPQLPLWRFYVVLTGDYPFAGPCRVNGCYNRPNVFAECFACGRLFPSCVVGTMHCVWCYAAWGEECERYSSRRRRIAK